MFKPQAFKNVILLLALAFVTIGHLGRAEARQPQQRTGILLVHGWAGDSTAWSGVEAELRGAGAAIDLPGHGADNSDVSGWSVADFARRLEQERQRRGIACLVLGAHSNGSFVAREYARRYPQRLGAIVVVEGTFVKPFRDSEQFRAFRSRLDTGWAEVVRRPPGLVNASEATQRSVRAMFERTRKATALATLDMLAHDSFWAEDQVRVPVTFIWAESPTWTAEHRERLARIAPRSRFVQAGGVSHYAQLDRPALVAAELRAARGSARCGRRSRH